MCRGGKFLLVIMFVLVSSACGSAAQPSTAAQVSTMPLPASATPQPTPIATLTPVPTATETVTPMPLPTGTATFTDAESTRVAQQTMMAPTLAAQMSGFSSTLLSQCTNLSDPPLQDWVGIPVMPQATAGQTVQTLIGSYYCFRAPVTVAEMETFYKEKLASPNWTLISDANGSMMFVGLGQTGAQYLFLVSGPGDKNDLIVAINATIPMTIPTPKP